MKSADNQSESDLRQQYLLDRLGWGLRDLTANLIRIARGAGAAERLGPQLAEAVNGYEDIRQETGLWPHPWAIERQLDVSRDLTDTDHLSAAQLNRAYAVETIIAGSLQIAASRLVGQRTQEAAGRKELHDGVRELEEAQRQQREEVTKSKRTADQMAADKAWIAALTKDIDTPKKK